MEKNKTANFIEKAKKIHGDKYDYSKVEYVKAKIKVCIICPEHGEFWQTPNSHLNGCGCKKCGRIKANNSETLTTEDFIKKAKEIHGNKYDYSKVDYINTTSDICIICPIHGEFKQTPHTHLNGSGCKKCGKETFRKKTMIKSDEWIRRAKEVHGDRYDYSKTVYSGYYKKVNIICRKHGVFQQIAYDHLQGKGCQRCRKSKLEIEISEFLRKNNINFLDNTRPKFLSNGKSHLSLDFYLPDYNAAIECQGIQHFIDGTFFDKRKETIKERDERKYNLCKKNGVKLYYFSNLEKDNYFDKVYNSKEELLKDIKNGKL